MIPQLYKFWYRLFAFGLISSLAFAQNISPAHFAFLNTRHVLFSFPQPQGAVQYQIFYKISTRAESMSEFKILTLDKPGVIVKDVFKFGESVTWKYAGLDKAGKTIFTSAEFRFTIRPLPQEMANYRFRVEVPKSGNEVVFMDNPSLAIDRTGSPVWFMWDEARSRIMDLRLHSDGNLGVIFVGAPLGKAVTLSLNTEDTIFDAHRSTHPMIKYLTFHHHFEMLKDKSYLIVGDVRPHPFVGAVNTGQGGNIRFPQVVINMTADGKVKWIWEADKYLNLEYDDCYGHINSASYNLSSGELLISMKDLSRIILANPLKDQILGWNFGHYTHDSRKLTAKNDRGLVKVVEPSNTPGALTPLQAPAKPVKPTRTMDERFKSNIGPFSGQHSVQFSSDGQVLMLNNNSYNPDVSYSTLLKIKKPMGRSVPTQVLWEHTLVFADDLPKKTSARGGVQEVAPNRYFTHLGSVSRMFESDSARNILWHVIAEYKDNQAKDWSLISGYKANMASSLFPAAFVAERWTQPGSDTKIRISNLGSENDMITINTESGKFVQSIWVKANSQEEVTLKGLAKSNLILVSSLNSTHVLKLEH